MQGLRKLNQLLKLSLFNFAIQVKGVINAHELAPTALFPKGLVQDSLVHIIRNPIRIARLREAHQNAAAIFAKLKTREIPR